MSKLWHMHSEVLRGFYASEIYLVAETREVAIDLAIHAFKTWVESEEADYSYNPLIEAWPGEFEYPEQLRNLYDDFRTEAKAKLAVVSENAVIFRRV
jgi:hypothetical protein